MAWARSCRLGERRWGTSPGPESIRKHCRYIPHSWVFIFLHHGMRLKQKQEHNDSKDHRMASLWGILASRGQEQTYSTLNPGPPLAKARFLNSVHTFCNCADWKENREIKADFISPGPKTENIFITLNHNYVHNKLKTKVAISNSSFCYWVFSCFIQVCMVVIKQKKIIQQKQICIFF